MQSVLIQLDKHPEERDLIGKIILAYGELELSLMDAVKAVLNGDTTTAMRTLFRLRSESNRIQVADAIARPWFKAQNLETQFAEAIDATNHCKKIRNQYAHCQWVSDPQGQLRFGNLEDAANTKSGPCKINLRPLTKKVLQAQFAYFTHAEYALMWVTDEYRLRTKQKRHLPDNQKLLEPPRTPRPKLDSRGEEPPLR